MLRRSEVEIIEMKTEQGEKLSIFPLQSVRAPSPDTNLLRAAFFFYFDVKCGKLLVGKVLVLILVLPDAY
jgi:hypothetical protein